MRWWGQHRAAECTKPTVPPTRRRRLRAALAAVLVPHNAPKLHLKREWPDNWLGIGLIIAGMTHQGWGIHLTAYAARDWRANFFPVGIAHSIVHGRPTRRRHGGRCSGRRGRRRDTEVTSVAQRLLPHLHMAAPQGGEYAIWVNTATFKAVQELADFADLDVDAFVEFIVKELHDGIQVDPFVALVVNEVHDRGRREGTLQAPVHQSGPASVIPINRDRKRRPERRPG
jgi:hypothetical protein